MLDNSILTSDGLFMKIMEKITILLIKIIYPRICYYIGSISLIKLKFYLKFVFAQEMYESNAKIYQSPLYLPAGGAWH